MRGKLKKEIIQFLASLPNIDTTEAQQSFIYSVGLDRQLQQMIKFGGSATQFVQLLMPTLIDYGTLEDGQPALEVVLESAKDRVGKEKQGYCDTLLRKLRASPTSPSLARIDIYKCVWAIFLSCCIFWVFSKTPLNVFELKIRDLKFQFWVGSKNNENDGLIIVALGDGFLLRNEQFRVSQEKLTSLITFLLAKKPKVIGVDVLLDKEKTGYEELVRVIKTSENIVVSFSLSEKSDKTDEIQKEFERFPDNIGFTRCSREHDNVARRIPLEHKHDGCYDGLCYSLVLQMLKHVYGAEEIAKKLESLPGDKKILTINFDRPKNLFRTLTIETPEDIEKKASKDDFYDKIVLIGYLGEKQPEDTCLMPLSMEGEKIHGVLIHAYGINTISSEQYILSWWGVNLSIVLFWALIGGGLSLRFRRVIKFFILVVIWISYVFLTVKIFYFRLDIPLWSPLLTLTLTAYLPLRKLPANR